VDGVVVHARHWIDPHLPAEGPVVLVPGLGLGSRMVRPVAEELAGWRHVHAPDPPGFGDSGKPPQALGIEEQADRLAEWMAHHGLEQAVLVGVSIGCQIAIELARRHPERCSHLVLGSPTVDAGRRRWSSQLLRWPLELLTQSLPLRVIQIQDHPAAGFRRVAATFGHALRHRPEDAVGELTQPVLVCWATRDPLVSRAWAEHLAHLAPEGRLVVLPGAVHALTHENPLELARVIRLAVDDSPAPER
jgi:pimeloyl-ACP methyl ester carboxylesterase